MSVTANGTTGLPDPAPVKTTEWTLGAGEVETQEWPLGQSADIDAKYNELKSLADSGGNITNITKKNSQGRSSLIARFARTGTGEIAGDPSEVTTIEELYAVDVLKDAMESPYFSTTADAGKGLPLSDDECAVVRFMAEQNFTTAEIDDYVNDPNHAIPIGYLWASWTTGMKELRGHLLRGVNSYFETAFVLRRSKFGVRTSSIKASFTNINRVVTAPTFSTQMNLLIESLPTGEWLYKPPQAENLGKGKWRITQEWQWANQHSVMYGGTFTGVV